MPMKIVYSYTVFVDHTLKGAPIADFGISTLEFGHETPTIGFVTSQNPGFGGRNYRFGHRFEIGAFSVFWCLDTLWSFFGYQKFDLNIKYLLHVSSEGQGTIKCQQKIRKNKSRFLRNFFVKNFPFFQHFFFRFFRPAQKIA